MTDEKDRHNHTGQTPTDVPSEKLIHPPKQHPKKESTKIKGNTTAKDPKLGSRNTSGR